MKSAFGGLTIKELLLRTWRGISHNRISGTAAQLAYYFLLALFPMLIFLTSLVGFLPGLQETILDNLSRVMPPEAMRLVRDTLEDVVSNRSGGLLSFGALAALWSASVGVAAILDGLNIAWRVKEGRSFLKQRAVALGLTVALALLVVGGALLIVYGIRLGSWLASQLRFGAAFTVISSGVNYLLGILLLFIGIEMIYYLGPNTKREWRWVTPGAVFAALAFILVSALFTEYLHYAPSYSATYGSLGAVVVLMLWLYLMGFIVLAGAQIDAEI